MSLSEDLRNELAAIAPRRECDRLAELSALFHYAGSLHLRGHGEIAAHLDLPSSAVARRAFRLLRSFGAEAEVRMYRQRAFDRSTRYQIHVAGEGRAVQVLHELGVVGANLAPRGRPPRRLVRRSCCRRSYVRGALLASGSLSGPRAPHLELRATSREGAEFIAGVAEAEGIELRVHERGRHAVAYAKGAETIATALAAAGASDAALVLQERAVVGAARSSANRLANADHANLVRTSRAAHDQLQAVRLLERSNRLHDLPRPLREMAILRLRHPALSVRELALKCRPPASKAAAYRRLRRLVEVSRA